MQSFDQFYRVKVFLPGYEIRAKFSRDAQSSQGRDERYSILLLRSEATLYLVRPYIRPYDELVYFLRHSEKL